MCEIKCLQVIENIVMQIPWNEKKVLVLEYKLEQFLTPSFPGSQIALNS